MKKLHFLDSIPEDIPNIFPKEVMEQASEIKKNGIDDTAISRQLVQGITVDGITSLDLDDAIWAERTEKWYRLSVHISDVAEAIEIHSPIDLEAIKRTTSIYRKDYIIPMIPQALSNELLSLNGQQENLTLSVDIDINMDGHVIASRLYESRFHSHKRYDYESFAEDAWNPDAQNYTSIALLDEIATLLHHNRIKRGWQLYLDIEDYPLRIAGQKNLTSHKNPHRIIEATMIAANHQIWQFLSNNNLRWLFREHLALDEKASYVSEYAAHRWLAISWYTHFTSPIRRIADLVNHRVIKAFLRHEPSPFLSETLWKIVTYTNKTVLRIQTFGKEIDHEEKGRKILERYRNAHGDALVSHHFSPYVRRASREKEYRLPHCIRQTILDDINNQESKTWYWSVGMILLWSDITLKDALYHAVIQDRRISPISFLNILAHTKLFRGESLLFLLDEHTDGKEFFIKIQLPDQTILHRQENVGKIGRMENIKWVARQKLCEKIFRHYMSR